MEVSVRLFAALRERAGARELRVELPEGASAADVWPKLGLGEEPPGLAYAVNRTYVDRDAALGPGDEVALIPPVSGGAAPEAEAVAVELTEKPLDLGRLVALVADDDAGAVASFVGTVRRHSRGKDVLWLDYEAFDEMAEAELARLAAAALAEHGCLRAAVSHRTGRVAIGEASVAIAVSAAHRGPALDACRQLIEELKRSVPIWKKERYADGEEWVGQGS